VAPRICSSEPNCEHPSARVALAATAFRSERELPQRQGSSQQCGAPQNLWTLADFREKFIEDACAEFGAFISNASVVCDAALAIGKRALTHHLERRRLGTADAMDDSRLRRWPDSRSEMKVLRIIFCMHFACMKRAAVLLTAGWPFSSGSPNDFGIPPVSEHDVDSDCACVLLTRTLLMRSGMRG
jgi:hypothetical protein